jgi:hypothetical protein
VTHVERLVALSSGKWGTHSPTAGGALSSLATDSEKSAVNGVPLKLTPAGSQLYHVHLGDTHLGTVGHVDLPRAGKGWHAWAHDGSELDAHEGARHEAVGVLVKHHLSTRGKK